MDKFDQLNNLLTKPIICFDILSKNILNRNIIKLANDILIEYEINNTINQYGLLIIAQMIFFLKRKKINILF